jgi:hypothetical protein
MLSREEIIRDVFCRQLFVIFCLLVFARMAMAQDAAYPGTPKAGAQGTPGRSLDLGTVELGIYTGYSRDNPTLMGRTTQRPFFEFNVQYARVVTTGDDWALKYAAEIIPVAIIRQPQQGFVVNGGKSVPVDLPGSKQKIYGAGLTPLGLQMNFRRGYMLQPFINGAAGVLFFTDQVPVADSSKFNFTLSLGAGVEIWYREDQSISLGYKYHHISNGYTARRNPGLDSNLFYVGWAWNWKQ